ncbi:hypothetical protein ACEK07_45865 [Alcanivoracaceae bacterium MT1]
MTERTDFQYIRKYYGVPAEVGRRVEVAGKPGVIAEDRGAYIGVLFDEDQPGQIMPCHPTWRVEYQGMGAVRKLSARKRRAKARYQRYREFCDSFDSFRDFLAWDMEVQRGR